MIVAKNARIVVRDGCFTIGYRTFIFQVRRFRLISGSYFRKVLLEAHLADIEHFLFSRAADGYKGLILVFLALYHLIGV
jgi:hypothetical protein